MTNNQTNSGNAPAINHGARLKLAYDKHEPRIKAIPTTQLIPVTFDVTLAYTTSHGKLAKLGTLKAEVRNLHYIDQQLIDELDERLLALGHALALHYNQELSADQLDELVVRVNSARQMLASDSAALAKRNLYPKERVVSFKGPISRAEAGFDVLAMSTCFRAHWAEIEGKTAVTVEELDAYDADADRMLVAIGARNSGELERVTLIRDGALTYFAASWEELRRGVSHIRWYHGDLDELVPSVFTHRNTRPASKKPNRPSGEDPDPAATGPAVVASDDDESPFSV